MYIDLRAVRRALARGVGALAVLASAWAPAALAAADDVPAVISGRLLATDPSAPPGVDAYLVEVDEVRHGGVLGGVLAVRLAADDAPSRRVAARALESGEPVELAIAPHADGSWWASAVRGLGLGVPHESHPPPLVDPAVGLRDPAAAAPRRALAAATAGAPFEHQVVEIVNEERLANGNLPPLKAVDPLHDSTGGHSERMATADFFAHCDPDAPTNRDQFFERMTAAGYNWITAAENIAAGSSTPSGVMALWMGSTGHRNNILGSGFREIGVGYVEQAGDQANVRRDLDGNCVPDSFGNGPYRRYWTQNFGSRSGVYPVIIEREAWEAATPEVDLYTYGAGVFSHMRLSNDGVAWSPWTPFAPDVPWTLEPGPTGIATVWAQLGNGGGPLHTATDTIQLCLGATELDLSAQTVTGTESFEACLRITAGAGFTVAPTGDVTFRAQRVVLTDGFSVANGGTFRASTE